MELITCKHVFADAMSLQVSRCTLSLPFSPYLLYRKTFRFKVADNPCLFCVWIQRWDNRLKLLFVMCSFDVLCARDKYIQNMSTPFFEC